jgi:AmmeMemoRadiSam system protein A
MSSLPDSAKQLLLEIARREIRHAALGLPLEISPSDSDNQPCEGAFVTLRRKGRLRGCIGQLASPDSLSVLVAYCARAAALDDPRFKPLRPDELADLEIDISALSAAMETAVDQIEPGKHGLIVSNGNQRGVLLPEVATQYRWSAERFLEETCLKAGLSRQAWKNPETRIWSFTAESFGSSMNQLAEIGPRASNPQNAL